MFFMGAVGEDDKLDAERAKWVMRRAAHMLLPYRRKVIAAVALISLWTFTVLAGLPDAADWDVRILASDIDTEMLARAERGVYPADRAASVPATLRERFFRRGRGASAGLVRVGPEAARLVTFRRINLRDEAWPIRAAFDAIFCRNVLIYFDRALQQEVIRRLVEHLQPGGYLFLGHSESLLGMGMGLRPVGKTVYKNAPRGERP